MISPHYDIVILGAGPAGLACAIELKNSSLSVLVIEKNTTIGPKICAGGLTGLADDFKIPTAKTRSFSKQVIIIKDKSYAIELERPIRTITRLELGQYQLQQVQNAVNITILTNTTVQEIQQKALITADGKSISFKYLVGADGSNSIVRKSVGIETKQCIGLYYDIPVVTDTCIWYLKQSILKSGYIWVFPHKEFTNIGVYFNPTELNSKKAKAALENYITNQGYTFSSLELKGSPISYSYKGHQFGNIFLVGDAAGLTSRASGEGISYALTSGKEIAKKIKDNSYKTPELNKMIRIKHLQDNLFKLVEIFPFLHDYLFRGLIRLLRHKRFQGFFGI